MSAEISHEEKIEAARARLKTAYDLWGGGSDYTSEKYRKKWEQRKKELELLLTPQNIDHELH